MKSRTMKVALAVVAFFLMCGASFAQSPWWQQRDRDYNRDGYWGYQNDRRDNQYERGLQEGRSDRQHNRGWHPRNGNVAYMNGYRAGYGRDGQGRRDNDWRNDRGPNANAPYGGYGNQGAYGNRGYGNQNVAYNNGFQEGLRYGQSDRSTGHSNRPTYSSTYQNGSNGYNSSYGDKQSYKNAFRNGYLAGYQQGYNGGYRR